MTGLKQMGFEELDDLRDKFSEEEINRFKVDFALFDEDGDGVVTEEEGVRALRACGLCMSRDDLIQCLTEVTKERNGKVTFSQFITVLAIKLKPKPPEQEVKELREAFMVFDREKTGFMSASDFRNVMTHLGEHMSDVEADHIIKDADKKGEGFVNIDAFVDLLCGS